MWPGVARAACGAARHAVPGAPRRACGPDAGCRCHARWCWWCWWMVRAWELGDMSHGWTVWCAGRAVNLYSFTYAPGAAAPPRRPPRPHPVRCDVGGESET